MSLLFIKCFSRLKELRKLRLLDYNNNTEEIPRGASSHLQYYALGDGCVISVVRMFA